MTYTVQRHTKTTTDSLGDNWNHLFGIWEITVQHDTWFSALYKYSYLLKINTTES